MSRFKIWYIPNCDLRGNWREGSNRYEPWILPADGQLSEWHGGVGQSHTQGHMGSTWRRWDSHDNISKENVIPFKKPWSECCNFSVMYGCRSLWAAPRGDNAVWRPLRPSATGTVARWTVCGFHSRARAPGGGTVQGSWADQPCPRAAGCIRPWREAGVWQVVQWAGVGFPSSFKLKSVLHGIHDVPSLLQCHRRPHSGIAAKAVHTGAARAHNPLL